MAALDCCDKVWELLLMSDCSHTQKLRKNMKNTEKYAKQRLNHSEMKLTRRDEISNCTNAIKIYKGVPRVL